jgi:hypothetical protein
MADPTPRLRRFVRRLVAGASLGLAAAAAEAVPIDPSSPTTGWTPVAYPSLLPDYSGDQRTGIPEADIVGNTSPATTTINSTPPSYALSVSNYSFRAVDGTIDPAATSFDIDADASTDQFLTWVIPFSDVVSALAAKGIAGFTDTRPLQFVVGSSTQPNALNQDLGGRPR